MKKLLSTTCLLLGIYTFALAQAPPFFNYQGVARNAVGNALVNKNISLRLTILNGSATGIPVYSETRLVNTNAFGLFNVQVGGAGATNVSGSIAGTDWKTGSKWMKVEIDTEGGSNFKDIGSTQLTSVPYSLYTSQSGDIVLPFSKTQNEESPLFKLTNSGNNAGSLAIEASSQSTANNATALRGIITSVAPGVFSAGVVGQNNGTGGNGVGVYGSQNGSGYGVYGTTPAGTGVYGNSTGGIGVFGQSVSNPSVMGYQPNTGTSNAGLFQNISTTNTAATLRVLTNGTGEGLQVNNTGLGKGAVISISNAASANTVLDAATNGTGRAGYFQNTSTVNNSNIFEVSSNGSGKTGVIQNTNAANNSNVLEVSTNGTGRAGLFQNTNAANSSPAVSAVSNGAGDGIQSLMTGTGKAGMFNINNAANGNMALDISSNGTNNAVNSVHTGTGRAGFFQVNNTSSTADALSAVTNGTGSGWAIRGTSSGTNGAGLFIQNNATNTANNLQSSQAGLGRAALFNATNAANTANALEVNMAGTGFAASFNSSNAAPKALRTSGAVQFSGIGEGVNRVLMTDISGNANWNTLASVGGVSGTGTLNFVPKWTPGESFVGNSQIFDNGTNVGINTTSPSARLSIDGNFFATTNNSSYAAIFENTNTGNGDGLKIKLGRAKTPYTPPAELPGLISNDLKTKMKNLIRADYSGNKLTLLSDLLVSNIIEDVQAVGGLAVGVGNYIINEVNELLNLPLKIGPYSTPEITITNGITLFPGTTAPENVLRIIDGIVLDAIPDENLDDLNIPQIRVPRLEVPSVNVIPELTVMPRLPNIDLSGIGIVEIPVNSLEFWGITAGIGLSDVPGSNPLNNENEFIRFADKNDTKMGSIRAVSVENWTDNYLNPLYLYTLYGALTSSKVDKFHARYHFQVEIAKALIDYSKLGIEYTSGNGDYAEWLERSDIKELVTPGDIVAVKGGRITKDLSGAEQVMVVSHNPIVLGNVPAEGRNYAGNNIAFMGQVPVKITGPVSTGDYIVAQANTPGYGIAKHPDEMTIEDFRFAVGRSWVNDPSTGPKMVNTVVGVHNGDYLRILKNFETKFHSAESRLKTIESKVESLIQNSTLKKGF